MTHGPHRTAWPLHALCARPLRGLAPAALRGHARRDQRPAIHGPNLTLGEIAAARP